MKANFPKHVALQTDSNMSYETSIFLSNLGYSSHFIEVPMINSSNLTFDRQKSFLEERQKYFVKVINELNTISASEQIKHLIVIFTFEVFFYHFFDYPVGANLDELLKTLTKFHVLIFIDKRILNKDNLKKIIDNRVHIETNMFSFEIEDFGGLTINDVADVLRKRVGIKGGDVSPKSALKIEMNYNDLYYFLSAITDEMINTSEFVRKLWVMKRLREFKIYYENIIQSKMRLLDEINNFLKALSSNEIEFIMYEGDLEIGTGVQQFLEDDEQGIFLRLYVPHGRYQAEQLESFLQIIESYLQKVEKLEFYIDRKKTKQGIIYIFKSKSNILSLEDIQVAITRFEVFMQLCQNDRKEAEQLVISSGMNTSEATYLVSKYLMEYQRIKLEIRHEDERKMLDLRQRFESEMLELTTKSQLILSEPILPSALLSISNNVGPISITISNSAIGDNPNVRNILEQAFNGNITYTIEDRQIMDLFERYAEHLEAIILKSQLELLKDKTAPDQEKRTAKQKIVGFLSKVAPAIGNSALTVLTAYLEKLLIGK